MKKQEHQLYKISSEHDSYNLLQQQPLEKERKEQQYVIEFEFVTYNRVSVLDRLFEPEIYSTDSSDDEDFKPPVDHEDDEEDLTGFDDDFPIELTEIAELQTQNQCVQQSQITHEKGSQLLTQNNFQSVNLGTSSQQYLSTQNNLQFSNNSTSTSIQSNSREEKDSDDPNLDYIRFLQAFDPKSAGKDINNLLKDDDVNDTDYNYAEDEQKNVHDNEEYRTDPAVRISKKEIENLLSDQKGTTQQPPKRGRKPRPPRVNISFTDVKPIRPSISGLPDQPFPCLSQAQLKQLYSQLEDHFQLLSQNWLMSLKEAVENNCPSKVADDVLKLMIEFRDRRNAASYWKKLCLQNPTVRSAFYQALSTRRITRSLTKGSPRKYLKEIEDPVTIYDIRALEYMDEFIQRTRATPSDQLKKPEVLRQLLQPFVDRKCFKPDLIPEFGEKAKVGRLKFTAAEDRLLAMGLQRYGTTNWESIIKYYLPTKTEKQLTNRYKNMSSTRGSDDNPIKQFNQFKKQPLTNEELATLREGIRIYGYNWDTISSFLLPHRKPALLKKFWTEQSKLSSGRFRKRRENGVKKTVKQEKTKQENQQNAPSGKNNKLVNNITRTQQTSQQYDNAQIFAKPNITSLQSNVQVSTPSQSLSFANFIPIVQQSPLTTEPTPISQETTANQSSIGLGINGNSSNRDNSLLASVDLFSGTSSFSLGSQFKSIEKLNSEDGALIQWEHEDLDKDEETNTSKDVLDIPDEFGILDSNPPSDNSAVIVFEHEDLDEVETQSKKWTKDEDRLILTAWQERGNSPSTWEYLNKKGLVLKDPADIADRFNHLMQLWNAELHMV